ncbi:unnamed protein product [Arabidopsis thaliana]|uniref:(thale cress) hypothetical protein n=1 Tax=Arabidopsis thaliana TaxID=3702 RepID=A0A7G2E7K1_ARATH|nr:unnamed protein product [Arabidopsis thaliana]
MALVMLARAPAPPLLLPSPNPQPCALPQDLTSLVSPSEPPDPPDPPDYLVGASNSFLSILLLRSSDLGSDLVQALSPLDLGFALRSITAVCSSWIKEKTYDVLTRNDLGSWTPNLFIEKWWFSQPHTSPKLRFFSHLRMLHLRTADHQVCSLISESSSHVAALLVSPTLVA